MLPATSTSPSSNGSSTKVKDPYKYLFKVRNLDSAPGGASSTFRDMNEAVIARRDLVRCDARKTQNPNSPRRRSTPTQANGPTPPPPEAAAPPAPRHPRLPLPPSPPAPPLRGPPLSLLYVTPPPLSIRPSPTSAAPGRTDIVDGETNVFQQRSVPPPGSPQKRPPDPGKARPPKRIRDPSSLPKAQIQGHRPPPTQRGADLRGRFGVDNGLTPVQDCAFAANGRCLMQARTRTVSCVLASVLVTSHSRRPLLLRSRKESQEPGSSTSRSPSTTPARRRRA